MLNYRQKHKDYNNFTCTNNKKKKNISTHLSQLGVTLR